MGETSSRMLKKSASFVLGSSKSSTYPRGYASGFDSPPALLDSLFEHPAQYSPVVPNGQSGLPNGLCSLFPRCLHLPPCGLIPASVI